MDEGYLKILDKIDLSELEIHNVKKLWNLAIMHRGGLTEIFYNKLFELDPISKPLFKTDLISQGWKLIDTLTFVIDSINSITKFENVRQKIVELGAKHVEYKVQDYQYPIVLESFLYTFNLLLADSFTKDMKNSWVKFYNYVGDIMINSGN
ncbi:MAG: hypothetical protein GPJ54_01415 [Candidatus Heimdallarchaeota archaeon]|nr:hypothetical protein [Candidatus Heimdallarchaeota archaeon]